jgi:hypothetical protein
MLKSTVRQLNPADSTLALSSAGAAGANFDMVPGTDNITMSIIGLTIVKKYYITALLLSHVDIFIDHLTDNGKSVIIQYEKSKINPS